MRHLLQKALHTQAIGALRPRWGNLFQARHLSGGAAAPSSMQPSAAASAAAPHGGAHEPLPKPQQQFKFCRMCGGALELVIPHGDNCWRHVCSGCEYVDYQNPKLVVGAIVEHEGRVLLCRRGIQPQLGKWTVPAGFMEMGESTAQGAARETLEEAAAAVDIQAPFVHFDIPGISQTYILFRGRLAPPYTFAAQQPESLEAAMFAPEEIPWDELAFSSVAIALRFYCEDLKAGTWRQHHGSIIKAAGTGPNTPGSFKLESHFAIPTTLSSR